MRLLLAEDERSLARALTVLLRKNNYEVDAVCDGEEAMAYLGVGEDFIDRLRNEALVSFSQFGRKIWYDLASLDRFILKNKVV